MVKCLKQNLQCKHFFESAAIVIISELEALGAAIW